MSEIKEANIHELSADERKAFEAAFTERFPCVPFEPTGTETAMFIAGRDCALKRTERLERAANRLMDALHECNMGGATDRLNGPMRSMTSVTLLMRSHSRRRNHER